MKQQYITPDTKIIRLLTNDNLAQFVITSKSVPESSGDAKPGYFFEEEDEYDNDPWGENEDWNAQKTPKSNFRTPYAEQKTQKITRRRGTMIEIWQKQRFVPLRKSKNAENRSA